MKKRNIILLSLISALILLLLAGCGGKEFKVAKKTYNQVIAADSGNNFIASNEGKFYFYNQKGKKIFDAGYDEMRFAEEYNTEFLLVRNLTDVGTTVLTRSGSVVFQSTAERQFQSIRSFGHKGFAVTDDQSNVEYSMLVKFVAVVALDVESNKTVIGLYRLNGEKFVEMSANELQFAISDKNIFVSSVEYGQDGNMDKINVYNEDGTNIFSGAYEKINVVVEHNHMFVTYRNGTENKRILFLLDGSQLDLTFSTTSNVTLGEETFLFIDSGTATTQIIQLKNDTRFSLAGTRTSTSAPNDFVVMKSDESFQYYQFDGKDFKKKRESATLLSYGNNVWTSANMMYDRNFNTIAENATSVSVIVSQEKEGKYYYLLQDGANYIVVRDGVKGDIFPIDAYQVDLAHSSGGNVMMTSKTVLGSFTIVNILSGEKIESVKEDIKGQVQGIEGVSYATKGQRLFISTGVKGYELGILPNNSIQINAHALSVGEDTGIHYIEFEITGILINEVTQESTSTHEYAYFVTNGNPNNAEMLFVYHDKSKMKFTIDEKQNFFVLSTVSKSMISKGAEKKTTVFEINRICAVDGEDVRTEYSVAEESSMALDNAFVRGDHILVEKVGGKHAVYNRQSGLVLSDIFYVWETYDNFAIVSFSGDENSAAKGIIEFTSKGKGYEILEKTDKLEIEFFNGFYRYVTHKDGIPRYTLKTMGGKEIYADSFYASDDIMKTMGNSEFNYAVYYDNGKNGYRVVFLKGEKKNLLFK